MSAAASIQDVLDGRARWCVVHGDNREVLPTLPNKSVAHVISDPPYSEHVHGKARRGATLPDKDGGKYHGESSSGACFSRAADLGFAALEEGQREALALEFARLAARWSLVFCDNESAARWIDANVAAGLQHIRIGQWIKLGCTPQFTGDRPATGSEAVVISHPHGRKRWNGGGSHAVWTHPIVLDRANAGNERVHTTQKPLPLMLELVELFTDPDEIILDPFAGSGTTGVAALRLGRRCILIEKDAKYAAVCRERMEAESKGLTLRDARAGQRGLFEVGT